MDNDYSPTTKIVYFSEHISYVNNLEYKKALKILCNSPPFGYEYSLIFMDSLDTDSKSVRRGVIERKFKDKDGLPRDAPWDIDRPGTQFAVACDIEIFPNINNIVHLAFMAIYPKIFKGNETTNKVEGAEGDFMGAVVKDNDSETSASNLHLSVDGDEEMSDNDDSPPSAGELEKDT